MFPPDFRVMEAGLVTGSNVPGFSVPGLLDIHSHSQEEKGDYCSLMLPQSTGGGVAAAAEAEPCLAASLLRCQGREPVLPDMLRKGQSMQIIG